MTKKDEEKVKEVEAKLDGKPTIKKQVHDYIEAKDNMHKKWEDKLWPDLGSNKFVYEYLNQSSKENNDKN